MISKRQLEQMAETVRGIPVLGCLPGSTAAEAGVRYGDIVLSVNGMLTPSVEEYLEARKLRTDGYELRLFRAGDEVTLWVPFRRPEDPMQALALQIASGRYVSTEPAPRGGSDLPS